jgi:phage terminase large subunit
VELRHRYRDDPVGWVEHVLGARPWPVQADILRAVAAEPRVTVRSCHGVGKSWTAACAALWFLYTREPVVVLTTAPTHRQVREVLWREVRRLHRPLREGSEGAWPRGELRETTLRLAEDRFALGLTTDEPDRFQGFHAPHVLVIVDEASGVSEEIFQAIEGVLTTGEARLLLIGNPLHRHGAFYASHQRGAWARFAISAFDCPNLAEKDPDAPGFADQPARFPHLVTARWVAERRADWGEASPLYQSRVLGEFPDQASDALLPLSWIEAAIERGRRQPAPDPQAAPEPVEIGVDVARFGSCETAACVRRGPGVLALHAWRGAATTETARRVEALAAAHGAETIRVDAIGIGAGVLDALREALGDRVVDVNVGRAPANPERFQLLRDELFFALRDRFRDGDIRLPDDTRLREQLAALTYSITPRGQQSVCSKDELARRGIPSPDRADALALAFAPLRPPRPAVLLGRARG